MKYTRTALRLARYYYTPEQFTHALRVADIALDGLGETLDADRLYAVGVLHDIIEDTHIELAYLREQMGDEVADDVYILSRRANQEYMRYIATIGTLGSPYAVRVKQADIKDHFMQKDTLTDSLRERYMKALPLLI